PTALVAAQAGIERLVLRSRLECGTGRLAEIAAARDQVGEEGPAALSAAGRGRAPGREHGRRPGGGDRGRNRNEEGRHVPAPEREDGRRERPRWGLALLMRPAGPLPLSRS